MNASAFFAMPAKVVGTSPVELATPALLKMMTSRSLASPSRTAGSQLIDLGHEAMKIANDILERGFQAALRSMGLTHGWPRTGRFPSGRVWQSISVTASTGRSRNRQGVRPGIPSAD